MTEGKLTARQREFQISLARCIINVAERHPGLRGPWKFDEEQLQARAHRARELIAREAALREANGHD